MMDDRKTPSLGSEFSEGVYTILIFAFMSMIEKFDNT